MSPSPDLQDGLVHPPQHQQEQLVPVAGHVQLLQVLPEHGHLVEGRGREGERREEGRRREGVRLEGGVGRIVVVMGGGRRRVVVSYCRKLEGRMGEREE